MATVRWPFLWALSISPEHPLNRRNACSVKNLIYHIDFMNYFMNIIPAAWLLKEIFPQFATGKGFR
nr:hypothetical protein KV8917_530012 [Klebsiella variicola]